MDKKQNSLKAVGCGIIASLFLSSTFIINSVLANSGGYWAWTAVLRSLFLIPILAVVLLFSGKLKPLLSAIRIQPMIFVRWGVLGFGVLYASLALASLFSPGWMVAAVFQINILAGMLLSPYIYTDHRRNVPKKPLLISALIVTGVFIMQLEKLNQVHSAQAALLSFLLVLAGAVVWPVGNRKLLVDLEKKNIQLDATQRVLGMTIGSLPLLIALSLMGFARAGLPAFSQCEASFYSALFSGFLGGVGFYHATQMVKNQPAALAAVEATQVFEIFFALIGEMMLTGASFPGFYGVLGMLVVLLGMGVHFINIIPGTSVAAFSKINKLIPAFKTL